MTKAPFKGKVERAQSPLNLIHMTWSTSIFPTGDGRYSLPLKKAIRAREGLEIGDVAQVHLETVDV